jgi:hypothetical protein
MKIIFILVIFFTFASFMNPKIFVPKGIIEEKYARLKIFLLKDTSNDKYFISDSIKTVFRKGYIGKSPLIAIDGMILNYQKNLDTIILPLKKHDITSLAFLNKKSSPVIYGANANSGAVIINTSGIQNLNDTLRFSSQKRD